jgi:hypothetical protein
MRLLLAFFYLCACSPTSQPSPPAGSATEKGSISDRPAARAETTRRRSPGVARSMFVCGMFSDLLPGPVVVADLRLRSGNGNRFPADSDVKRIQATGGTVLHRFNVALVRVRVDTGALHGLVSSSGIADYATLVDDTSRFDASVQIFLSRPITADDIEALRRLKVKASPIPPRPNILYAVAEDRTIPTIQKMAGVDFVRARAMECESDF